MLSRRIANACDASEIRSLKHVSQMQSTRRADIFTSSSCLRSAEPSKNNSSPANNCGCCGQSRASFRPRIAWHKCSLALVARQHLLPPPPAARCDPQSRERSPLGATPTRQQAFCHRFLSLAQFEMRQFMQIQFRPRRSKELADINKTLFTCKFMHCVYIIILQIAYYYSDVDADLVFDKQTVLPARAI